MTRWIWAGLNLLYERRVWVAVALALSNALLLHNGIIDRFLWVVSGFILRGWYDAYVPLVMFQVGVYRKLMGTDDVDKEEGRMPYEPERKDEAKDEADRAVS